MDPFKIVIFKAKSGYFFDGICYFRFYLGSLGSLNVYKSTESLFLLKQNQSLFLLKQNQAHPYKVKHCLLKYLLDC